MALGAMGITRKLPKPPLPAKYTPLPDDELLDSNNLAWIWSISKGSVSANVKSGRIPSPDVRITDGPVSTRKHYWRLGSIRKFIEEIQ